MSTVRTNARVSHPVTTVAIAPGSGVLGESIGIELFNRGLTIVSPDETSGIIANAGLEEFEVSSLQGVAALREKGIDAVLVVKTVAGRGDTPESASVRVTDTSNGQMVAGLTWQNGWGGASGSPADMIMRKNLNEAATEISRRLYRALVPNN